MGEEVVNLYVRTTIDGGDVCAGGNSMQPPTKYN